MCEKKIKELEIKLKNIEIYGAAKLSSIYRKFKNFEKQIYKSQIYQKMTKTQKIWIEVGLKVINDFISVEYDKADNLCLMCYGVNGTLIYEDYLEQIINGHCEGNFCKNRAQEALERMQKLKDYEEN